MMLTQAVCAVIPKWYWKAKFNKLPEKSYKIEHNIACSQLLR